MTMTDTKTTSSEIYRKQGMGQRIGFGQRPAVLVIDMQHDFCDPEAPTTLWPSIGETYAPIWQLCTSARARRVPVFYTQGLVAGDGSSAGLWRYKQRYHAEGRVQIDRSKGAAIIPDVARPSRAITSSASGDRARSSAPTSRFFSVSTPSTRCWSAGQASAAAFARR